MGIKVDSGTQSGSINIKDFLTTNTDEGYGTTDISGYYSMIVPIDGKPTLYIKTGLPSNPLSIYVMENVEMMINIISKYEPLVTTELQALAYINDSADMILVSESASTDNNEFPKLILDARRNISYYGDGNIWYDVSGEDNHGSITNSPYYNKNGRFFEFTGDPSNKTFVTVTNSPSVQVTYNQTLEFILRVESFYDRQNFFNKSYGGEGTITLETPGDMNYYWGTNGSEGAPYQPFSSGVAIELNKWYHIILTRDLDNNIMRWVINGVQTNTLIPEYAAATPSNNSIKIGDGYTNPFHGDIALVKVMSNALTLDQAKENYHQSAIVINNLVFSIDPANHVSYTRGATVSHCKVSDNDVTLFGNIQTPSNANYWNYDGSSAYMQTTDNLLSQIVESYSVELWVYINDDASIGYGENSLSFIGHGSETDLDLRIQKEDELLFFHMGNGGSSGITAKYQPVRLKTWYHIIGVRENNINYLYINGELRTSGAGNGLTNSTNPLQIGKLNGRIGLINVYDIALDEKEVFKNYNANINRFDTSRVVKDSTLLIDLDASSEYSYPGSGNTWYDISGNDLDATIIGEPVYKDNKFILTGSEYFELDPIIGDTLNGLGAASVEIVSKRASSVSGISDAGLLQLSGLDSSDGTLYPWTDDSIYLDILRSNRVVGVTSSVVNNSYNLLEFTTLTIVKDGDGYKVYLNGVLVNTLSSETTTIVVNNIIQGGLTLGRNSTNRYFVGDIHALRIYTTSLSDIEVSRHHEINIKNFLISDYGQLGKTAQIAGAIAASGGTLLRNECLYESVKYTWNMEVGLDMEAFAKTFEIKLATEALGGTLLDTLALYNSLKNN